MFNVNPDIVCRLIDLAREFHAQEEVSFPETPGNPSGDWAVQMLASHADDLTAQSFDALFLDLEPDQQREVVALMWLGRGDYTLDDWDAALEQAEYVCNEDSGKYLLAHPLLPEYLADGLDLFGYSCE